MRCGCQADARRSTAGIHTAAAAGRAGRCTGQATIVSGVLGGEIQLTDRLRSDLGVRVEYNNFNQSSENTSLVDLDGDSTTSFDQELCGNGTFRHFNRSLTDWAASLGLNYTLTPHVSLYGQARPGPTRCRRSTSS